MPINYAGSMPGPSGESDMADGQSMAAGEDMSAACQKAVDSCAEHLQAEAGKLSMRVSIGE